MANIVITYIDEEIFLTFVILDHNHVRSLQPTRKREEIHQLRVLPVILK